jgi:hypothetical protein
MSRRLRTTILLVSVAAAISLTLTACSPVVRTAVRVNDDGTVDFVSCFGMTELTYLEASSSVSDDDSDVQLRQPTISQFDAGEIITFAEVPANWERIYIGILGEGDAERVSGIARRDQVAVGEWYWGDGQPFTDYFPEERCEIQDGDD